MSNTYAGRNETLRELGFATYKIYLESEQWKEIKRKAYAKHGYKCKLCPKKATELHHFSYSKSVLLGNDLDKIIPVCGGCHLKIEFKRNGEKRKLASAQTQYKILAKIIAKPKPKFVTRKCPECGNTMSPNKHKQCKVCMKSKMGPTGGSKPKKNKRNQIRLEMLKYAELIITGAIVGVSDRAFMLAYKVMKSEGTDRIMELKTYQNGVKGHPTTAHLAGV